MKTLEQQIQYERDTNRLEHENYCIMTYDEWEVWRNDITGRYYVNDLVKEEWYEVKLIAELIIDENNIDINYLGLPELGGECLDSLISNDYFGQKDTCALNNNDKKLYYDHYMWFEIINK